MPRTSPVHYINPSAISLTANANGSANDIAVYIDRNAKIKVYSPKVGLNLSSGDYQEWSLRGRNRRLANSAKKYAIYARLRHSDHEDGYLVFAAMEQYTEGPRAGQWYEKYWHVGPEGWEGGYEDEDGWAVIEPDPTYWYIKLGEVSLPENHQRTIDLDTGILGTEQFNTEWALNPDALPLRIELGCTIGDEDAGPTPYVYWGQSLVLTAMLTEGWTGTDIQRFDRWEIIRNSGDAAADNAWNYQEVEGQDTLTPRQMPDGQITLQHIFGGTDDFNGAVSATFTILAVGHNADTLQSEILRTATINIMAETVEKYELSLSENIVSYDPQTQNYSPDGGVDVGIRATDQRGEVFDMTREQIANASLMAEYTPVDSSSWTALTFSGSSQEAGIANIGREVFALQQSVNVRLMRRITVDGQTVAEKELSRATIAFVRNGEDSKIREWIYRLNSSAGYNATTGTAGGTAVSGETDGVDNCLLVDDFVPSGWSDDPTGVSQPGDVEWESWRDYDDENHRWGAFHTPVIHNRYAEDAVTPEQIFLHTSTYPWEGAHPVSANIDGDVPSGWSAVPVGVTQLNPYEYRSIRRKTGGVWGPWSTPQLDAKWSSDGTSISIKGGADMVIGWNESLPSTDTDGFRCLMNNSDGDDMEVYEIDDWQQLTGSWQGYGADIGDIYLVDGDMWMKQNVSATASSPKWKNLGRIQGPAGNDGKNAVRIDLDNQADIIACREDGTVRFTRIVTVHASIYDGGSPATAGVSTPQTVQDMAIAGVTPTTFSLVDGLLTVTWQFVAGTVLASGSYAKDITLNYNGESYTAQFSLTSSNTSAVYQLHPNMSEVSFQVDANGSYTPPTQNIYCGYTKTDGGGSQTFPGNNIANLWREGGAPYNIFWRRQLSDGTFSEWRWTKDLPSGVRSIDSTTTDIGIEFAMSSANSISLLSDQNIIDRELVAIVKGGKNGPKGDDAKEVNPNILLRTIFDRGIDFVLEAWTRTNELIAIDSATDTIVNGRKSLRMNASALSQDLDFQQNVFGKVKPSTWYTLSFNYFATQSFYTFLYDASNTTPWIDLSEGYYIDGSATPTAVTRIDGFHEWEADWSGNRHSITFKTASTFSTTTLYVLFRCLQGGQVAICMPKLEEGRTATAYMAHESDLKGDSGQNTVIYDIVFNEAWARIDNSGNITARLRGIAYIINGQTRTPLTGASIRYGYILDDPDTYANTTTNSGADNPGYFSADTWFDGDTAYFSKGSTNIFAAIIVGGEVMVVKYITIARQGADGVSVRGKTGRFYYYAGVWKQQANYSIEETQAPYVKMGNNFYMLDNRGVEPATLPWSPSTAPGAEGDTAWTLMSSLHQYYIAQAFFGENAYLGSFIINGDWMLSQYGTYKPNIDTTIVINASNIATYPSAYTDFKAGDPLATGAAGYPCFAPNYAVDGRTGRTYQQEAYVKGEIHVNYLFQDTYEVTNNSKNNPYYIRPWENSYSAFVANVGLLDDGAFVVLPPRYYVSGEGLKRFEGLELKFYHFPLNNQTPNIPPIHLRMAYEDGAPIYYPVKSDSYPGYLLANAVEIGMGMTVLKMYKGYWWVVQGDAEPVNW